MNKELDEQLCKKYPRILRDRHGSMQTTLMCWQFDCGDGWYNILDILFNQIQNHINRSRDDKVAALRYNRAIMRIIKTGNKQPLVDYYLRSFKRKTDENNIKWAETQAEKDLKNFSYNLRAVKETVPQVVALQVKEKFGTLRFYYTGGDEVIDHLVYMAESFSGVTCEVCGNLGKLNNEGWIKCLCEKHEKERNG
jgi:hypothetical protein